MLDSTCMRNGSSGWSCWSPPQPMPENRNAAAATNTSTKSRSKAQLRICGRVRAGILLARFLGWYEIGQEFSAWHPALPEADQTLRIKLLQGVQAGFILGLKQEQFRRRNGKRIAEGIRPDAVIATRVPRVDSHQARVHPMRVSHHPGGIRAAEAAGVIGNDLAQLRRVPGILVIAVKIFVKEEVEIEHRKDQQNECPSAPRYPQT